MNCSRGITEGCMKGVTSSLGPEGEGEFHPADKGPHLGYCWWERRKASSSRRERHRLNTAQRALTTVANAHSEPHQMPLDCGVSSAPSFMHEGPEGQQRPGTFPRRCI